MVRVLDVPHMNCDVMVPSYNHIIDEALLPQDHTHHCCPFTRSNESVVCESIPHGVPTSMGFDSIPHFITNDDVDILPPNSVWDNVSTLISHIIPISPSTTMSAAFHDSEGCRTFSSCILLSHRYAISAAIDDAALYGARTLAEGLGLDYSLVDNHVAQVHSSGILDFIHTLSLACMV